ncbi:MAG: hypothetical protein ACKOW9_05230 [Candidatus Paceibacterota bacterium]
MIFYFRIFLLLFLLQPLHVFGANLEPYYIQKIDEVEKTITIKDVDNKFYLVVYGPECASWWKYVGQRIYINASGRFLDGVGDDIFLGVGTRGCRVREVSSVKSGAGYYVISSGNICPERGFVSPADPNTCECNTGYKFDADRHLCVPFKTNDQICREKFGVYAVWDGTVNSAKALNCKCKEGFIWNQDETGCLRDAAAPVQAVSGDTEEGGSQEVNGQATQINSSSAEETSIQHNTQRTPWYKTFFGLVAILVAITFIVHRLIKYYKNK